ncbi:methyltransferase-like protein 22 isoform X2 [Anopheles bellator]|uniref:methyltransferase-like protein 22 isoform X2 n=1 Tax=Anopheles bellator TaxID=139047 RepID=UPI0026494A95|nr:methyltransferase-like protein 22 isoform X2 [Anopheles bellator]
MSLEVTSELYAEAEFCSTDSDAVSKFTFVYPGQSHHPSTVAEANGLQAHKSTPKSNGIAAASPPPAQHDNDENGGEESADGSDSDSESVSESGDDDDAEWNDCCSGSTTKVPNNTPLELEVDKDGDVLVKRLRKGTIEIEHRKSTRLDLVGLQIWRGALLLADYILHNERKFKNSHILELGSGVGLTSIVASMYARQVICTDIDIGGLLDLIRSNIERNAYLSNPHCRVNVEELNFKTSYQDFTREFKNQLQTINYVIAADVIYDDEITEAFVRTIVSLLLELPKLKAIYIALEKRYVFTLEDMESVAPCYDYFLRYFEKRNNRFGVNRWKLINVCMDFPRYFDYAKVKDLVLLKICHAGK